LAYRGEKARAERSREGATSRSSPDRVTKYKGDAAAWAEEQAGLLREARGSG
jgi:hypothetical protein